MPNNGTAGKRTDPVYQAQEILSRRDHSEAEVRQKLQRKKFTPQQVEEAIAWLKERRLLNDEEFARRFTEGTLTYKAVGQRWMTSKLRQKGISSTIITKVLSEAYIPGREQELASAAAKKWQRSHPAHAADTQRLTRFLISRGFSFQALPQATDVSGDLA